MKKHLLIAASLAALLTSCTSEVIPERPSAESFMHPIEFSGEPGAMTRADDDNNIKGSAAATLLSDRFKVYGVKYTSPAVAFFKGVFVHYTTENGWNYTSATEATRYWDPNATKFKFFAFSDANETLDAGNTVINQSVITDIPNNITVEQFNSLLTNGLTIGSTSQNVTLDQLKNVYFAKSVEIGKGHTGHVNFLFKNAAAKIRIAFYNAIPGYNVQIDNFYTVIDGMAGGNKAATLHGTFYSGAAYNINLSNATTSIIGTPTPTDKITLGTGCADVVLGKSITKANFDKPIASDDKTRGDWTWVMPVYDQGAPMKLKIDYRLISSHETINRTSTVVVPANFAKWEANHAYTYFFKITDNDLHPITFDAEVIDFETNIQETITTADAEQDVDITTFAAESDVQNNNQYKKGNHIYVGISSSETITEPEVHCAYTDATGIDGSDAGSEISEWGDPLTVISGGGPHDGCYQFVADKAGTYVIRVTYKCLHTDPAPSPAHPARHTAYKVITVVE